MFGLLLGNSEFSLFSRAARRIRSRKNRSRLLRSSIRLELRLKMESIDSDAVRKKCTVIVALFQGEYPNLFETDGLPVPHGIQPTILRVSPKPPLGRITSEEAPKWRVVLRAGLGRTGYKKMPSGAKSPGSYPPTLAL
jgi:hypothetical protein